MLHDLHTGWPWGLRFKGLGIQGLGFRDKGLGEGDYLGYRALFIGELHDRLSGLEYGLSSGLYKEYLYYMGMHSLTREYIYIYRNKRFNSLYEVSPKYVKVLNVSSPKRDRQSLETSFRGAVKELKLRHCIGETLLFTIYTHYGNLI